MQLMTSQSSRVSTNARFCNFVFTLNNPTDEETLLFRTFIETSADGADERLSRSIRYIVFQEETGSEGTRHFQGYIELSSRKRFTWVRRNINSRMHIERRRGTQAQAIAYAQKEDTRVQGGLSGSAGLRANASRQDKLKEVCKALQDGEELVDIEDEFPVQMTMYKDKIQDFAIKQKGIRNWAMNVEIFVGQTGSGKSYTAAAENTGAFNVPWPVGGRWWWPDYKGEECVIMDEFRHQIKYDVMLKMMDRYAWCLESKGRSFQFVSRKIVITTNIDPKDWYPNLSQEVKAPLCRRINEFADIYDFSSDHAFPDFEKTIRQGPFTFNESRSSQATPVLSRSFHVPPIIDDGGVTDAPYPPLGGSIGGPVNPNYDYV